MAGLTFIKCITSGLEIRAAFLDPECPDATYSLAIKTVINLMNLKYRTATSEMPSDEELKKARQEHLKLGIKFDRGTARQVWMQMRANAREEGIAYAEALKAANVPGLSSKDPAYAFFLEEAAKRKQNAAGLG